MIKNKRIPSDEPDLGLVLRNLGDRLSARFKCHRVGRIKKINTDRLTVDVELMDKLVYLNNVSEITELSDLPLLIYGGSNSGLTFGNIVGCECLVHFNDTDIDNWYATGESYEPNTGRQHDFSDGFVELRPYSLPKKINYDMSGTILFNGNIKISLLDNGNLEFTNGSAKIVMSGNDITITGDVTVSGTIYSETDVVVKKEGGNISLLEHVHTSGLVGEDTSAPHAAS